MRKFRLATLLFALVGNTAFAAGGSYLVDDAAVTPEASCQVESWLRRYDQAQTEGASTPACTTAGVEYSVTLSRIAGDGDAATSWTPGLKWAIGDIEHDRWAIGVAATATVTHGVVDDALVYVPLSVALDSAANVVVHANVGQRQEHGGRKDALAGIGIDVAAFREWHALAEFIRIGAHERTWQGGLRRAIGDSATVDVIYGYRASSIDERWLTVGLNLAL